MIRKKTRPAEATKSKSPRPKVTRVAKLEIIPDTQLSPNLAWMYPYLKKAKQKMPNLNLPKRIRSFKPTEGRIMRVLGNAHLETRNVVIATHHQITELSRRGELRVKKIVRLPHTRVLDTLAHEIAHLHYPDHGYEHEEFTKAIFKAFDLKVKCQHCKGSGKVQLEGKY